MNQNSLKEEDPNSQIKDKTDNLNLNRNIKEENSSLKSENKESQSSNLSNVEVKNEKVAKDLASLNTKDNNESLNVSKKELEQSVLNTKTPEKKEEKSLLDKLVEESKFLDEKKTLGDTKTNNEVSKNDSTSAVKNSNDSKDFLTNIYLSTQRSNVNKSSLANKVEALN